MSHLLLNDGEVPDFLFDGCQKGNKNRFAVVTDDVGNVPIPDLRSYS